MASVEEGWSIEYGDFLDPETAYELFWGGAIRDKQQFICPFCGADMTCINLDAEEQDWIVHPHYRGRPRHKDGCEEKRSTSPTTIPYEKKSKGIDKTDELCFTRPNSFFSPRKQNQHLNSPMRLIKKRNPSTTQRRYSIRPLVSKFITYRTQGTLADNFVSIEGEKWTYESLFKGVYYQEQFVTDRPVIYWGTARVQWIEKSQSYLLTFCKPFVHQGQEVHPSLFVPKWLIDNYPVKRLLEKRLNKAIENKSDHRAFIFIYGPPIEKMESKSGRVFLNFELNSLDLIEIRSLSLFDHL
ncbi:TPA: hypothetical protein I7139_21330 [Vibrio vulnificus]|nr:hypothetical protein [Vibrio vulnificus]